MATGQALFFFHPFLVMDNSPVSVFDIEVIFIASLRWAIQERWKANVILQFMTFHTPLPFPLNVGVRRLSKLFSCRHVI
jgi:hypothetical protein